MARYVRYLEDGVWKYASIKDVGDLALLKTLNKTDLVSAINELYSNGGGSQVPSDIADRLDFLENRANELIAKTEEIEADIINKADLTYVDGKLIKKLDSSKYEAEYEEVKSSILSKVDLTKYQQDYKQITEDLANKVEQSGFNDLKGRVDIVETDITNIEGELSSKVSHTVFDDAVGVNQWVASKYPITVTDLSTTPPSFALINGMTASQVDQYEDSQSLLAFTDKNTIIHYFTNVKLKLAKTITLRLSYDDSVAVFMNGARMYENKDNGLATVEVSLPLRSGWNTIEILHGIGNSNSPKLDLGLTVSSLVDKMTTVIGVGDKNETRLTQAETSIKQNAESIELKASKTEVSALGNKVADNEASIDILSDEITSKVSQTEFNAYSQRLTEAESKVEQTASSITSKVDKTEYDLLNQKVDTQGTTIAQLQGEIELKVDSTTFDGLKGRVETAESQIKLNTDEIALKASKSELDTVSGKVTSVESQLTIQAGEISTKVSQKEMEDSLNAFKVTELDPIKQTVVDQGTEINQTKDQIELKANKEEVYTKLEVDGAISAVVSETDTKISQTADLIQLKANSSDVYTKVEVDDALGDKADGSTVDALVTRVDLAESTIEQTSKEIALKVSSEQLTSSIDNTKKYIQSRGANLVTNGNTSMNDNTNFSKFIYDGSAGENGSFLRRGDESEVTVDELITVDTTKKYRFSLSAKQALGVGRAYFGYCSYDVDRKFISYNMRVAGQYKPVELTQELKVGDTVIHLSDVSEFVDNKSNTSRDHSLLLWGYKNSYGYEYPVGTYSRFVLSAGWKVGAIDRENNTITLSKPFSISNPSDPEGIFRVGHQVSPTKNGGEYVYTTINTTPPTKWRKYESIIEGIGLERGNFAHGTAFIQIVFLLNMYSTGGQAGDSSWIKDVEFYDITQEDNAMKAVSQAQSEIKITTDGIVQQVSGISSTVDKQGQMIAEYDTSISTLKDQIKSKVSSTEVKSYIDAIKIGGTNLLPNSGFDNSLEGWSMTPTGAIDLDIDNGRLNGSSGVVTVTENNGGFRTPTTIDNAIVEGSEYTISFWIKSSVALTVGHTMIFKNSAGVETSPLGTHTMEVTANKWTRFEETFTVPVGAIAMATTPRVISGHTGEVKLWIDEVQVEEGNKATSWKPNNDEVNQAIEQLSIRLKNAEQIIEDDSIVSKVTTSQAFINAMDEKANSSDLADYVTNDALQGEVSKIEGEIDNKINAIDFSPYVKGSELQQTTDSLTAKFTASGGVNLIKNSVGFAGLDFWTAVNSSSISTVNHEALDALGFGSGYCFMPSELEKSITQTINVASGSQYTLSWHVNKENESGIDGELSIEIVENDIVVASHRYLNGETTAGYKQASISYTAVSDKSTIIIKGGKNVSATVTGIMMNIGSVPLQWTMAHGEIYNSSIRMDMKGIKVSKIEDDKETRFTVMTPSKFAGYYDADGDGIINDNDNSPDEVFRMNDDEFMMKKAVVKEEISLGSVKILRIESTANNGWAFVPSE